MHYVRETKHLLRRIQPWTIIICFCNTCHHLMDCVQIVKCCKILLLLLYSKTTCQGENASPTNRLAVTNDCDTQIKNYLDIKFKKYHQCQLLHTTEIVSNKRRRFRTLRQIRQFMADLNDMMEKLVVWALKINHSRTVSLHPIIKN